MYSSIEKIEMLNILSKTEEDLVNLNYEIILDNSAVHYDLDQDKALILDEDVIYRKATIEEKLDAIKRHRGEEAATNKNIKGTSLNFLKHEVNYRQKRTPLKTLDTIRDRKLLSKAFNKAEDNHNDLDT